MAEIIIREQDLTTASDDSILNDVVYVPGYAIMGPINEPVLCENLSTFRNIFGSTPYRFNHAHSYKDISYAVDDYEKSYLYAAELLSSGLPVLFERVTTTDELNYAETTLDVKLRQLRSSKVSFTPELKAGKEQGATYEEGVYTFTLDYKETTYAPAEMSTFYFSDLDNSYTLKTVDGQNYTCDGLESITVEKQGDNKIKFTFTITDRDNIDLSNFTVS